MNAPVVALFGPTTSGKSAVALALARRAGGELVSCDAMQLYAGLPLLSNQPAAEDRAAVPHHLIGHLALAAEGGVADYAAAAHAAIDAIVARGRLPIVVGGTGLYLCAALAELALPPRPPTALRAALQDDYDRAGPAAAHARLVAVDPRAAARVHPNDRRRVVRALELQALGSSLAPGRDVLFSAPPRLPSRIFGLLVPREELHRRIAARTDAMLDAGVVDEVRTALAGVRPSATASRMLGLPELRALIAGELDLATARRRIVERTRQYARRQESWLRRLPDVAPLDGTRAADELAATVEGALREPVASRP